MEKGRLSLVMSADPTRGYLTSKLLLFPLCDLDRMIIEVIDQIRPSLRVNGAAHNDYFEAVLGRPGRTVSLDPGKLLYVSLSQIIWLRDIYLQRDIVRIKLIGTCINKTLRKLPDVLEIIELC